MPKVELQCSTYHFGVIPGSPSASQYMEENVRNTFATRTAGTFFDRRQWQVACRVVPLMDHLWTVAALGHTDGVQSKQMLEESWGVA